MSDVLNIEPCHVCSILNQTLCLNFCWKEGWVRVSVMCWCPNRPDSIFERIMKKGLVDVTMMFVASWTKCYMFNQWWDVLSGVAAICLVSWPKYYVWTDADEKSMVGVTLSFYCLGQVLYFKWCLYEKSMVSVTLSFYCIGQVLCLKWCLSEVYGRRYCDHLFTSSQTWWCIPQNNILLW